MKSADSELLISSINLGLADVGCCGINVNNVVAVLLVKVKVPYSTPEHRC